MPTLPEIPSDYADPDTLFSAFTDYVGEQGIELYEAQEEAILSVLAGDHTIVATPTGSGKSMVALAALYSALSTGCRAYYTAPIKALVSEKFFDLTAALGAENVGMITGDSAVNSDAPIICATAEILANQALREGSALDVGLVVMDEFHYFGDPQRGWAWQVPLLEMPQAQFVFMSATLGDMSHISADLTELTGREVSLVTSATRPVPLEYSYSEEPLHETLRQLMTKDRAPVYIVSFAQAQAVTLASSIVSANLCTREEREAIAAEIKGFRFAKGFGQILRRLLSHGIGVHHAGMLPRYRRLVEQLAGAGLLRIISGTDTLGVGINVPIRTVLLTGLAKFDGRRMRRLSVREFQQIAGRAGRAGFDSVGYVVAQAPEHVIENQKALAKAGDDPKKRRKVRKQQPPAGFVGWSQETFEQLTTGQPEELRSRMQLNHATILNLLSRPGSGVHTIRRFIDATHETEAAKIELYLKALKIGRALLRSEVIRREVTPASGPAGEDEVRYVLQRDLGPHFALNQPLSPFALAALDLFDRDGEDWALNVLSIIEATTPVHFAILKGQLDRIKQEELATLKADGVDYTERMAILDELTYPQPNAEILETAFDAYAETSPWVREVGLEPKAIVADMIDQAMNFSQFVAYYRLARVEGGLLRYLMDVYRALVQNVPADAVDERLQEIIDWLGELIARVDSSLVEEWEALRDTSGGEDDEPALLPETAQTLSSDRKRFTALIRNTMFHRVLLAERAAYEHLGELDGDSGWDARAWEDAIEDFYEEYGDLRIDADARSSAYVQITEGEEHWTVRQILADPDGDRDWAISARVDVAASDSAGEVVVEILDVGPMR
ncbi:DEAD/DEAH box helicase [Brevibacterium otitidis]|uniref:DEAD/DEAH box helicase n=1 Tax=Brevibacterium otitidis TaxID=53364 RepID=A0ABV5X2Q3_9MICO|nr:DEAD/DEAH box helicase [Brevibacterium otitidis]